MSLSGADHKAWMAKYHVDFSCYRYLVKLRIVELLAGFGLPKTTIDCPHRSQIVCSKNLP
jgi:hypothetical protein